MPNNAHLSRDNRAISSIDETTVKWSSITIITNKSQGQKGIYSAHIPGTNGEPINRQLMKISAKEGQGQGDHPDMQTR